MLAWPLLGACEKAARAGRPHVLRGSGSPALIGELVDDQQCGDCSEVRCGLKSRAQWSIKNAHITCHRLIWRDDLPYVSSLPPHTLL